MFIKSKSKMTISQRKKRLTKRSKDSRKDKNRAGESVLKVRGLNDIVTKEAPPCLGPTGRKIFEIMVLYIGLEVV